MQGYAKLHACTCLRHSGARAGALCTVKRMYLNSIKYKKTWLAQKRYFVSSHI